MRRIWAGYPARMRRLVVLVLLLPALASCGGSDDPKKSTPPAQSININLEILDDLPPSVYANLDGQTCHSPADNLIATGQPPTITIEDGSGTVVAAQDGPAEGGTFEKGAGCRVPVLFTGLKAADVYVIKVTSSAGEEFKRTVPRDGLTLLTQSIRV